MVSEFVRRNRLAISVLMTLVCAGVLVALFGNNTPTSPGAPATATEASSGASVSPTSATPEQPAVSGVADTFRDRVLDFEEAYYLPDSAKRIEALRPFVTETFLNGLTTQNSSLASDNSDVTIGIDRSTATVIVESFDENDDSAVEVSTAVAIRVYRDDTVINSFTMQHRTIWIQADSTWLVYSSAP